MLSKKIENYLLLLGIGVIWGAQFSLHEIAIRSFTPDLIAAGRIIIGMLTLVILSGFMREPKTTIATNLSIKIRYVLIALFEGIIPFVCITWGQQTVNSNVAAVLIGTVPIFTTLFIASFVSNQKINMATVLSIVVGFVGLLILVAPSLSMQNLQHVWAEAAILVAAISFSIAMVLINTLPMTSPVELSKKVLMIAAIPMFVFILVKHGLSISLVDIPATLAVIALGVFCSGIVYILFAKLIFQAGAEFASMSNYLVPLLGTLFSAVLMQEHIRGTTLISLAVIISALLIKELPMLNRSLSKIQQPSELLN